MMKQFITFIRHGALPAAFADCFAGERDIPLSEAGVEEGCRIGRHLAGRHFDAVYSGTLTRVRQTREAAAGFAARFGDFIADTRLNELDFGDWSLVPFEELRRRCPAEFSSWNFGQEDFAFPGGEKIADFNRRTRAFLADVRNSGAERVAVFSHGGVIMSLLADVTGMGREHTFAIWIERGGIAEVELSESGDRLTALYRP